VRLSRDDAKKLVYRSETKGKSISEVVRMAIRHYSNAAGSVRISKPHNLFETGYVGCAEGDGSLSTTYKRHLTDFLLRKHGYR
jgi:hypothetical protein